MIITHNTTGAIYSSPHLHYVDICKKYVDDESGVSFDGNDWEITFDYELWQTVTTNETTKKI